MKKLFLGITILLLCIGVNAQTESTNTTYYLIRHAEKVASKDSNPKLTSTGEQRAQKWAELFKNIAFDAIYSTNYIRTMATAKPTASAQQLDIINYHPGTIDYTAFKESTKGKIILVVGHSNTIPAFVNKLIGKEKYQDIADDNNANLYVVDFVGNQIVDKLLYVR